MAQGKDSDDKFKSGVQCLLRRGNHEVVAFVKPGKALLGNNILGWEIVKLYTQDRTRWTFDWLVEQWAR